MIQFAYMTVTGARQGEFRAESLHPARKDKWSPILAFAMSLASPHDSSGHATGRRQFLPVRIVKGWGASSPQGLTACAENETLKSVTFEFERKPANGAASIFQTVILTNASITNVARAMGRPSDLAGGSHAALAAEDEANSDPFSWEEWTFIFEKIEVVDIHTHLTFTEAA
jgi:type VI secretion system secreted protein Hcp